MNPTPAVLYARLMSSARFRHLQAFASVAELGSTNRASDAIGMSQPAVTNLIADLEQLLECTLFYRHTRGMRMTEIAQELLPFVRRALGYLEEGTEFVAFRRDSSHQIVRIGAIRAAISGLLVRALPTFSQAQPHIMVELSEANASQISELISNREIDLLLCREPPVYPDGWEFTELMADRIAVVAGPQHPLIAKRFLAFTDLLEETWVFVHPSMHARRLFDEVMAQHGCEPRYRKLKTRSFDMNVAQLQSERLLLFAPYGVARQMIDQGQLAMLDVVDTPMLQPIGVLNPREGLGEAASSVKAFLRQYVKQHP